MQFASFESESFELFFKTKKQKYDFLVPDPPK